MKFESGSPRFLVMAACIFTDRDEIERASAAITKCKVEIGKGARRQFKHTKTSNDVKDLFIESTRLLTYDVRAIVLDKQRLHSDALMQRPGLMQNYAITQMFSNTVGTIVNVNLVIDGRDSRAFRLKSARYFLREVNERAPGTLTKVTFDDSVRNPLIQLADMTA